MSSAIAPPAAEPTHEDLLIRFRSERNYREAAAVIVQIAEEWSERVGDYSDAVAAAQIMRDPLGWFDRRVPVPIIPIRLVKNIDRVLSSKEIDFPEHMIRYHFENDLAKLELARSLARIMVGGVS